MKFLEMAWPMITYCVMKFIIDNDKYIEGVKWLSLDNTEFTNLGLFHQLNEKWVAFSVNAENKSRIFLKDFEKDNNIS